MFPVQLTGEMVILRELESTDLEAALLFVADADVTRSLPFEPQSRDEERKRSIP